MKGERETSRIEAWPEPGTPNSEPVFTKVRLARSLAILLLGLIGPPAVLASEIRLIDARTGFGLDGVVEMVELEAPVAPVAGVIEGLLEGGDSMRRLSVSGRSSLTLSAPVALRAEVPGYRVLHTVLRPAREHRGWTLVLEPLELEPMPVAERGDHLIISGWISAADTLAPVADARVMVGDRLAEAVSDADGYFELELPAPRVIDGQPEPLALAVHAYGFPDWFQPDLLLGPGGFSLPITLGGEAPMAGAHRQLRQDTAWPEADPGARLDLNPARSGGLEPPASITVGFADAGCTTRCCTGGCPHSCTFSLEEYSRRGLPKEWIASWAFDALAAGAVAYRSYGAWHVFNPPSHGAYDLCSSACCQVNEPGTHSNTNTAVAATVGLMLVRNGQVFRTEYSAQNNCLLGQPSCVNNDLSCGNGFVGSPATGWPCLADSVGLDRACFGHGRGMSQWGNHYWSLENPVRRWKWQLEHYYNASGQGTGLRTATISQVLEIDALRVIPAQSGPGQTITLELDVRNLAAETHAHVIIGASLRRPPGPFIDDPANDQPIVLPPGQSTVSRSFDIPPTAVTGYYDVYASLYLDVDRNGQISSEDLVQQLVVLPAALGVGEGVFWDRFEWKGREM
jgi:hypothetical protein